MTKDRLGTNSTRVHDGRHFGNEVSGMLAEPIRVESPIQITK